MKYAQDQKDKLVRIYFELQKSGVPVSIRSYAAMAGVKYYTFRDWYRDYKASSEFNNISIEEYSEKRKKKASDNDAAAECFSFVKISSGGNYVL